MEENLNVKKIIAKAAQWNFEGDCSLLSWMQQLSQQLEQRATATSESLRQLSVNVNRTAIALDNTANSLSALQYTQFVESRCYDDDETLANAREVPVEMMNETTDQTDTQHEILKTFLQNNLEMLHSCHEKYTLDIEDSDEDESMVANNCIYQPKNPYNDALLPHIYGSKLWKENWHVGLCDGANEYSGDEVSEAFSESSSSSHADNESCGSDAENVSECASNSSIPTKHHKDPAHVSSSAAEQLSRGITVAHDFPNEGSSDTGSTTTFPSTTTYPPMRAHNLFAAIQDDRPTSNSSTSSSSAPQHGEPPVPTQRNIGRSSTVIPPFFDSTPPPTDIFSEAVPSPIFQRANKDNDKVEQKSSESQIKRKPINLFDDDDFNSFMTEIVDKAQTITDPQPQLPSPASRKLHKHREADSKPVLGKMVDLFAEPILEKVVNIKSPTMSQQTIPIIESPKEATTRKQLNLFDSPEGSPRNELFISSTAGNINAAGGTNVPAVKPIITAKSLFDDDDDDDDFLNLFGSKKPNLAQRTIGQTLVLDDTEEEILHATKESSNISSNLFENIPQVVTKERKSGENRFNEEETNRTIISKERDIGKDVINIVDKSLNATNNLESPTKLNIFDENKDITPVLSKTNDGSKGIETAPPKPKTQLFYDNVLDADVNGNVNDLFKKQSTNAKVDSESSGQIYNPIDGTPSKTVNRGAPVPKPIYEKSIHQSLFEDEFEDDDLFASNTTKTKSVNNLENKSGNTIESPQLEAAIKYSQNTSENANVSSSKVTKSKTFLDEVFLDESEDLFSTKVTKYHKFSTDANVSLLQSTNVTTPAKQPATIQKNTPAGDGPHRIPLFVGVPENDGEIVYGDAFNQMSTEAAIGFEEESESNVTEKSEVTKAQEMDISSKTLDPPTLFTTNETTNIVSERKAETKDITITTKPVNELALFDDDLENENIEPITKPNVNGEILKESLPELGFMPFQPEPEPVEISTTNVMQEKSAFDDKTEEIPIRQGKETQDWLVSTENTLQDSVEIPITSAAAAATVMATNNQKSPVKQANANNHNYASVFLEEPPDDDDFFATLTVAPPLSTSKLALDLENDFYEPILPQLPTTATMPTETNTKNSNIKHEPGGGDYGGLRLFNEIPPEDDDFNFGAPSKVTEGETGVNQRLHSIFYDDFSETLEAVQQIKKQKIPTHTRLDTQLKLDDEHFDIVESVAKADQQVDKTEKVHHAVAIGTSLKDSRSRVEEKLHSIRSNTILSRDETDRSADGIVAGTSDIAAAKLRSNEVKLQMPKIDINVQALLPSADGIQNYKKSATTTEASKIKTASNEIENASAEVSKEVLRAQLTMATSPEATNENILTSVCKTRVRAPAARRPSTRRARYENYRKSMVVEHEDLDLDLEYNTNEYNSKSAPIMAQSASTSEQVAKEHLIGSVTQKLGCETKSEASIVQRLTKESTERMTASTTHLSDKPSQAILFAGDVDDYDSLLHHDTIGEAITNVPKPVTNWEPLSPRATAHPSVAQPSILVARKNLTSLTADFGESNDDNDDGDSLFDGAHTTPVGAMVHLNQRDSSTITATISPFIAANTTSSKTLFTTTHSDDSDDDLFKSSMSTGATTTKTAANSRSQLNTTAAIVSSKLDSIFGSDDEDDDFLLRLKPKNTPKPASLSTDGAAKPAHSGSLFSDSDSDEENLFSGGSKQTKVDIKSSKGATANTNQHSSGGATRRTTIKSISNQAVTAADNPLADLLNT